MSNKEAKLSSYSSLSKIYTVMHLINVQTKSYHIVKMTDQIAEYEEKNGKENIEQSIMQEKAAKYLQKSCVQVEQEDETTNENAKDTQNSTTENKDQNTDQSSDESSDQSSTDNAQE